jgi:hypothetical protein
MEFALKSLKKEFLILILIHSFEMMKSLYRSQLISSVAFLRIFSFMRLEDFIRSEYST